MAHDFTFNAEVASVFDDMLVRSVPFYDELRRMTVEMFDLKTLKLIAPVRLMSDFGQGKYLVYKYNRSCEFRLVGVRSADMPVSAIFFDH